MELFKLFGTIAVNNDGANSAIDETTNRAEGAESKMSAAFKKIGTAVATYFAADKIIAFGKEIVNASAEVDAETSAFEQIMGDYTSSAREKLNSVADATGVMSTRMQGHFTSLSAKFKGLGFDVTDATDLAQRGLTLAADAAAFWDKSLDDSSSALNSFINGSYEGGEAIGLFANDTQLAMYAVQQGVVGATKDWAALDEATKQATRLEFAENMYAQSGATGQAAREASQYANVQANLTEKWRQFKAEIGQPFLQNIVLPAMEKLSGLVDKASTGFEKLKKWVSDNKEELKQAANTISKLAEIAVYATGVFAAFKAAMAIQKAVQGFQAAQVALSMLSLEIGGANLAQAALNGTLTIGETIVGLLTGKIKLAAVAQGLMSKGQTALNAVMAANPIALIITGIAALVAVIIYLWNNCEWFRNFWVSLWDEVKKVAKAVADWFVQAWTDIGNFFTVTVPGWFNSFKDFFSNLWGGITDFLSSAWETIKNVVQVGIMFIGSIISAAFQIITLPFRFIWENCKDTIISVWDTITSFLIGVWDTIKDAVTTAFNAIKDVVTSVFTTIKDFITNVWNSIVEFFTPIFNAIKNVFVNAFNFYKDLIVTVFNAVKDFITNVWSAIKNTISNVVNGIKNTVSNVFNAVKSSVTSIFDSLKSKVTNVWNGIKSAIETPINKAKDTVKGAVDKIKSFFDNLKIKFPDIKLPHFNLTGKFSLSPPSVPKLSIDWYKKAMDNAMLLNSPTIFGMNGAGQLMGGGEAGQEVVAGSNTLMNMIRETVRNENSGVSDRLDRLTNMLAEYFPEILAASKKSIVLNNGVLVGQLAPDIDSQLGSINKLRDRGQ